MKPKEVTQYIRTQSREGLTLLPVLRRKRRITRHWLLSARWAYLALLIVAIGVPTILVAGSDLLMEQLFPPTTTEKLFGLIKRSEANPNLETGQLVGQVVLWLSGVGLVLLLFWLHIPSAVSDARRRALELAAQADEVADREPSRSVILYNTALEWSGEHELESQIQQKIAQLDQRLGANREAAATQLIGADAEATRVIEGTQLLSNTFRIGSDRYEVAAELGRGAMGIVYRGTDLTLDRPVALKQLAPALIQDAGVVQRFRQEARALARLSHPNIVQVFDLIDVGEQIWIAMELVDGTGFDEYLQAEGALSVAAATGLGAQMARGLACAHDEGIVHRDFKPANVLLTRSGQVKIMDFGVAKLAGSSVATQVGTVLGTPAYMSPEQAAGRECDARADIYALGITLFKMVSGEVPFQGDTQAVLAQQLTQEPPHLSTRVADINPLFAELVAQMLAKDPAHRPQSMLELADSLAQCGTTDITI